MTPEQRKLIAQAIRAEAKRELSRRSFWEFCKFYDPDFFQKRPFISQIADAFQQVYDNYVNGKAIRVSISMPPRAGKSYTTSLFCAWWLGKFPELSVMRNSCTDTLFMKLSYDVRNIVKSEKWQQVFKVKISADKANVHGWNLETSKQVGYFGAGVGGTIIGFGAGIAISDDLYRSMEDALSETYNDKVHRWKEAAHDSRKEKNCPEIYIGTRWSKDDVIGKAHEKGKIDIDVKISALDKNGETFCDAVKSTAEYKEIQSDIERFIWMAEYQQEPIDAEGLLFNPDELRYFKPDKNITDQFEGCFSYTDVADQGTDYLSSIFGKNIKGDVYIIKWIHSQEGSEITEKRLAESLIEEKTDYCQIESNNQGYIYARNVSNLAPDITMNTINNTTEKHTRIVLRAGNIKKRFVFLHPDYQDDEYKKAFQHLTGYHREKEANKKNKDAADAAAGLVDMTNHYLSEYYS